MRHLGTTFPRFVISGLTTLATLLGACAEILVIALVAGVALWLIS